MMTQLRFPAMASRADVLISMARQFGWRSGAEIGVADGKTSAALMTAVRPLKMIGVDHWPDGAGGELYYKQDRTRRRARMIYEMHDARLIEDASPGAADQVGDASLDFVFIDGDHSEAAVRADIAAWLPKVRRGGWVLGHNRTYHGVAAALVDYPHDDLPDDCWAFGVTDQTEAQAPNGRTVALVIGGAACIWDDMHAAINAMGGAPDFVVACNDIGADIPHIDAWVTIHANKFRGWKAKRTKNGYPAAETYTHDEQFKADHHVAWALPGQVTAGSSGLFAAKVALMDLGADNAILCGIPMDDSPHFNTDRPWDAAAAHWPAFEEMDAGIKARIRSMSGRTRDYLGAPDAEWLG